MPERILMDGGAIARTLNRLSHEIYERNKGLENVCLIGIRRRGEILARRIRDLIRENYACDLPCAGLDIGMYRDDLVSNYFVPDARANSLGFDDVLHTGRSVRAAIEAIFDLGRPASIRLLVLCDRGGREMPVFADFVGKNVPTSRSEFIDVRLKEIEGEDALGIRGADPAAGARG